jgi:predicted RNase H-like HicB family nuclease
LKREEQPVLDTVEITLCLVCTVKREGRNRWVTGCPKLDLFSQGKSEDEAKRALEEAIFLWVEDCFERGTLEQALEEVGFRKVHPAAIRSEDEHISVRTVQDQEDAEDTFPLHISIPAYQAAALIAQ